MCRSARVGGRQLGRCTAGQECIHIDERTWFHSVPSVDTWTRDKWFCVVLVVGCGCIRPRLRRIARFVRGEEGKCR